MELETAEVASPVGPWGLVATAQGVCLLHHNANWDEVGRELARRFGPVVLKDAKDPCGAASRLRAYFGGDLQAIDSVPVDTGGTVFQRAVWAALRRIPAGRTTCYSALAAEIGRPYAVRAVGAANGANPVAVIVPCHRVIGKSGGLTGYAGGLERKAFLLRHEGVIF
jgi:O-6-methylguanine DNA methyltransferase